MPRHYSDADKRLVLDRLIANHGDVARTADEFKLTTTTIYRWMKQENVENIGQLQLQQLQQMQHLQLSDSSSPSPFMERGQGGEVLPPQTTEAFQTLHDTLLTLANTLSHRIEEAIDEAPLGQRVAALAQLIDRIAKLASMLPKQEEEVIYVHEYEYGVAHHVEKDPPVESEDSPNSPPENQTGD